MTEGGPAAVSPSAWSSSARPGVPTGGEFVRVVVPGSRPSHGRASCVRPAAVLSAWSSRACPGISGDPGVATGGDSVRGGRPGPVPGAPGIPVLPPAVLRFGVVVPGLSRDLRRSRCCHRRRFRSGGHPGLAPGISGGPTGGDCVRGSGDVEIARRSWEPMVDFGLLHEIGEVSLHRAAMSRSRLPRRGGCDVRRETQLVPGDPGSPTCGDTVEQSKASVPSPISNWSCLRVLSDPEATDDQDALS